MDLLFSLTKHKGAPPLAAAAPRDVQCPGRVTQPQLLGAFNIYRSHRDWKTEPCNLRTAKTFYYFSPVLVETNCFFLFSPSDAAAVGRIEIFLCSLSKYLDKSIFYSAHETKAVPFTFQTTGKKVDYFGIYTCSLYTKTLFCVSCTVVIDEKNKKTFVTHNLH